MVHSHKIEDIENLMLPTDNISTEDIKSNQFQNLNPKTQITI